MESNKIYIIVVLIIILFYINYNNELFDSVTPQDTIFFNEPIYTSGSSQRFFGTTFSSTDQGSSNNVPISGYMYA